MIHHNSLAVSALLSLSLVAACGDDGGGSAQADAQQGGSDGAVPDAEITWLYDAGPPPADADLTLPDADLTMPDADLTMPDAAPPAMDVMINEVLLDQSGNDKDEFVEIKGLANTDYTGLTILEIDGDEDGGQSLNPGLVVSNHPGCTTDANGYCQVAVNNNTFQNGSQTILLVMGGTYTDDVTDIDANNDGAIDTQPWTTLIDGVAILNSPTDYGYAGTVRLMKTVGSGEPVTFGGASRIPDGIDTDTSADWTSNTPAFDNSGIASGEARNTPAAVNSVEP